MVPMLDNLPTDMIIEISYFLALSELINLSQISKFYHDFLETSSQSWLHQLTLLSTIHNGISKCHPNDMIQHIIPPSPLSLPVLYKIHSRTPYPSKMADHNFVRNYRANFRQFQMEVSDSLDLYQYRTSVIQFISPTSLGDRSLIGNSPFPNKTKPKSETKKSFLPRISSMPSLVAVTDVADGVGRMYSLQKAAFGRMMTFQNSPPAANHTETEEEEDEVAAFAPFVYPFISSSASTPFGNKQRLFVSLEPRSVCYFELTVHRRDPSQENNRFENFKNRERAKPSEP